MASSILPGTGLGSGVDIQSIVKVLVTADTGAKANQIKRQTANNTAMISGVASLKSALFAYQAAMKKLNDNNAPAFNAYGATSSDDKIIKATANNIAVAGSYVVNVTQLATSSKVASQALSGGATRAIPAGDLTIKQNGVVHTVTIGADATLQSVRDTINAQLGDQGISANIVNEDGGSRLVFSSSATGEGSDITVGGDITELEILADTKMAGSGAGYIDQQAKSAQLTVDGLPVTSKTNTIDSAISGLTLNLVDAKSATITVGANNEGLKASVQKFVDAYNTLVKTVASLTATSKDADDNVVLGPLTGDPTSRSLLADLRTQLATVGAGDQLTTLGQLGINTLKDGTLEFSATKFTAAMDNKKLGGEVQELFAGTNGVFERMNAAINPYLETGGILDTRNTNLSKTQKGLGDQQLAIDRRIETLTASLTKRYVAMDTLVGKLEAQRNNIISMFDAIEAQQRNS